MPKQSLFRDGPELKYVKPPIKASAVKYGDIMGFRYKIGGPPKRYKRGRNAYMAVLTAARIGFFEAGRLILPKHHMEPHI